MSVPRFIAASLLGFFVLTSAELASAAFGAHPAAPRCDSCSQVQRVQQLDCNALAQVHQFGGCAGFCENFSRAWGNTSQGAINDCTNNCNTQLAQCAGGGGGGGGGQQAQPNCQWYERGGIRKYTCRIY